MSRILLRLDERNVQVTQRVQSILHSATTVLLAVMFFARQSLLGQTFEQNWDIGLLMMLNGLFMLGGLLYCGGVTFPRIRLRWVLATWLGFCVVMFLLVFFDQVVIKGHPFDLAGVLSRRMLVVAICCAVITAVFALFAYLGQLRADKEIE